MNQTGLFKTALLILGAVLLGLAGAWYFLLRTPQTQPVVSTTGTFEDTSAQNTSVTPPVGTTQTTNGTNNSAPALQQKVFKLADGPVAGATFVQTLNPTTTIARYVMANDGHAFDLPVAVPGAVARAISNTTIPGIVSTLWPQQGKAMLLQYLEGQTLKTLSATFPAAGTSSVQLPARIQFLPDNVAAVATSPDGASLAYLLHTSSGVDGYLSAANGTASKKLFSLPLSEVTLSWPAPTYLLVETKPAQGVPAIALSVNAKTGAVAQVVYAPGLSAIVNGKFTQMVYQTTRSGSTVRATYVHDIAMGTDAPLSYQPLPEKCRWSPVSLFTLFCATPLSYVPPNYLDLWHQGTISAADSIVSFNTGTGVMSAITTPGGSDGGVRSDAAEIAISPDGQYLLFITKSDRSLWAVRLTQ